MKKLRLLCLVLCSIFLLIGSSLAQSSIGLNEIFSRGTATDPDWIEIYNSALTPVDISGYKIYDSGGQSGSKPKKEMPAGTVIAAQSVFVVVTEDGSASAFGLSGSGEKVWLEDNNATLIDTVSFPALQATESYSRFPDGGAWKVSTLITRGTWNTAIRMNEIFSRGVSTDPDWIEIYNSSATAIDITGYKIWDSGAQGGSKPKKEFPAGTLVPANGFFVIVTDDTASSGFGLSGSGEKVWLEDNNAVLIDSVTFPGLQNTESYGRLPDGGPWKILTTISRGTSNSTGSDVAEDGYPVTEYRLLQNYPNPFNPITRIEFYLPKTTNVTVSVYTITGQLAREVVRDKLAAGWHRIAFDATGLASGVYFYSLQTDNFTAYKRMILMK